MMERMVDSTDHRSYGFAGAKFPFFASARPHWLVCSPNSFPKKAASSPAHLKLEKGKVGFEFVEKAPRVKKTPTKKAAVKAETYRRSRQTAGAFRGAASRRLT